MKIKFCDLNHNLVNEVAKLGIESICADYFLEVCRTKNPVMMTASNPNFTMGGGLDYAFKKNYPHLVNYKQTKGGGNERIGNIIFTQTVGHDYLASKEIVKQALEFAIANTNKNETLLISGLGCGIGKNLSFGQDDFCEVLKEVVNGDLPKTTRT